MHEDALTMNEGTILQKLQTWRRPRYSARPFALTILAITLISLLASVKGRQAHNGESLGSTLRKRDVTILDEEVT